MTQWRWSNEKADLNLAKHGVGFELAVAVLEDPLSASRPDIHPDGDRFQTIGNADPSNPMILLVVHTEPVLEVDELVGRIISARKATARERRIYANQEF